MVTLHVDGMTCGHCVRAVTNAVTETAPGTTVEVDLEKGTAAIGGPSDLPLDKIKAAIEEEGYTVTGTA